MQGMNFGEFRQFVPEPEIPVAYHVLTWDTVADHLRTLFGPRRQFLEASDRNPALLLACHFARALVFNDLTVLPSQSFGSSFRRFQCGSSRQTILWNCSAVTPARN
jgi:hypothetical protein